MYVVEMVRRVQMKTNKESRFESDGTDWLFSNVDAIMSPYEIAFDVEAYKRVCACEDES